jgi:RNA polymerase sigma-70 factor (ECF subfamily)
LDSDTDKVVQATSIGRQKLVQILLRERTQLLAWLLSALRDGHRSEDVFQDVMVRALEHEPGFDHEDGVRAWAWRVARHRAFELLRQSQRQAAVLDHAVLDQLADELQGHDPASATDRIAALGRCLEELTDNTREIVRLRYVEGLAARDVAAHLHRQPEAIYKALTRVYATLSACIERQLRNLEGGLT